MDIQQAALGSLAEAFTFLFVTLGPLNIIVPFAAMTKGRTSASKRRLAFKAILLATIVSGGALLLAAGAILFLVALAAADRTPSESELAFSPLAFPTIVTPYGLALLILLFTLHPLDSGGLRILLIAAFVLASDLLAMLCTDLIAKIPCIKPALNILGYVIGVLLIALGVQAVADGLRFLSESNL
jgi:multiple antibiotic resistance protein